MALWGNSKVSQPASTQGILKFAEIRDGIVVTKTGELRVILLASSINFALKSEQEQNAIVFAYQNFLNSLEFPIQIVVQSKKLDLGNYLNKLQEASSTQVNELLRMQMFDYIDFIKRLINIANIMDKKFYVSIPYMPPPKMGPGGMGGRQKGQKGTATMSLDEFNNYKTEISQRSQVIQSGLGSVGIRCAQLNTQQVIELLYGVHNPSEATKEKLTQVEHLTSQIVESEIEKPAETPKKEEV